MKKYSCIILFASMFCSAGILAQIVTDAVAPGSPNILPPSPDAYNFTKYSSLPIGINTGTAQFSLPVYNISAGTLTHAVSINYSSNGVKVDEMSTRTGINWNLKAGGVITRTVLDLPDGAPGVHPVFYSGSTDADYDKWDFYKYVKQASNGTPPDFQPDEYSFNVDGYAGRFLRRENGIFTQFTSSAVKIEKNINGFILTAPTGTRYYFYISEITKNCATAPNPDLEWIPQPVETSWLLTKILSSSGVDSILFNYTVLPTVTYKSGISQDVHISSLNHHVINTAPYSNSMGEEIGDVCIGSSGLFTTVICTENSPNYISSIVFNAGKINFIYSARQDVIAEKKLDSIKVVSNFDNKIIKCYALNYSYSNATNTSFDTYVFPGVDYTAANPDLRKRLFLTEFKEISNDLLSAKKHSFEYEDINGLPPRLSFSQDRYGSFNGKINTYFFPNDTWFDKYLGNNSFGGDRSYKFDNARKGVLKKITYPAGGYTQIEYQPNKVEGDYDFVKKTDSVFTVMDTSTAQGQVFLSPTFYFDKQRDLSVSGYCNWASRKPLFIAPNGGYTDLEEEYYVYFEIVNAATNTCFAICGNTVKAGTNFTDGNIGIYLPVGTYYIKATTNRKSLRAKIILKSIKKESIHSEFAGIGGICVKSITDFTETGVEANRRQFIYGNWEDTLSSGTGLNANINNGNEVGMVRAQDCGYNVIHSNSVLANYLTETNTVLYKKVIELNTSPSLKNNGGTEYEYFYEKKKFPVPVSYHWPNFVWEAYPIVPDNAQYLNNDFKTGLMKSSKVFSYNVVRGTRNILQQNDNYYSLDTQRLIIDTFNVSKKVQHKFASEDPSWPYFIQYEIYKYWRYFGFLKLDSSIETRFSTAGNLINKAIFSNYSFKNYKAKEIKTWSSMGLAEKKSFRYVSDITFPEQNFSYYNLMAQANILDPLIQQTDTTGREQKAKNRTVYTKVVGTNIYAPSFIYSMQRTGSEDLEMSYQQYDDKGNILQYTAKDGIITSFLWGYKKQYPVAKIIGKSYAQILSQSFINNIILNDSTNNEPMLRRELDKLYNLTGCFVSTYIYKPLVGITSEKNANKTTVYYSYDNYNRLSLVRDKDSNIIKKICYNYKGQLMDCGYGTAPGWSIVNSTCQLDGKGQFTGNTVLTEKDLNPSSPGFNTTRTSTFTQANPACVCNGVDKKVINGTCETGVKVCTGNFRQGAIWQYYYHYLWSDNTVSATYIGAGVCEF